MTEQIAERLDIFKRQEELALFPAFKEEDAFALGNILVDMARAQKAPLVIDIRTPDRILFHVAMPGSGPDNDQWVNRKSNVALRYHQSSMRVGETLTSRDRKVGPEIGLDPIHYAAHGGSFPIRLVNSGVIGAVTVSGLPSMDDHRMVVAALSQFLKIDLPAI